MYNSRLQYFSIDGKQKTLSQHLHADSLEARLYLSERSRPVLTPNFKKAYQQKSRVLVFSAFLGNNTKSVNPAAVKDTEKYDKRFKLQSKSRDINYDKRVRKCCRALLSGGDSVTIKQSDNGFSYSGLHRCESVWICPVCSAHIVNNRRRDLGVFIDEVYKAGHYVSMLTLTLPHGFDSDLKTTLEGLSNAYKKMLNRKTWKSFKKAYSIVGTVRTLEVTYGRNGWHPHFHILLISKSEINTDCIFDLLNWWIDVCVCCDLPAPNEHGVSLDRCTRSVNDYIQKWGIDYEMTCGNQSKKSDKKGKHPFQILADSVVSGDASPDQLAAARKSACLFREYSKAFHGKRQLVYSEGLKALYKCSEEKTDAELLKDEEQKAVDLCFINKLGWKQLLKYNNRGDLLDDLFQTDNIKTTIAKFCLEDFVSYPVDLDNKPKICNFQKNAITRCY